jgi:hypothetical protein
MSPPLHFRRIGAACAVAAFACCALADSRVALTASADPAYTQRKYGGDEPRAETYVFMQGRYYEGHTVDRSIERMPFRRIAEYLAPQLARQQYLPASDVKFADLVIVVHWGTTLPVLSIKEMTARTSSATDTSASAMTLTNQALAAGSDGANPLLSLSDNEQTQLQLDRQEQVADAAGAEMTRADNVALLGYTDELFRMRRDFVTSAAEQSLRHDLTSERYFIILKAYDLRSSSRRPIWTMNVNASSPGNNFRQAMDRMSVATVQYVGRSTSEVRSIRPDVREGQVKMPPLVILNEVK